MALCSDILGISKNFFKATVQAADCTGGHCCTLHYRLCFSPWACEEVFLVPASFLEDVRISRSELVASYVLNF